MSQVRPRDPRQQSITSGFFAEERLPAIAAIHVQAADEEEADEADDAEGEVETGSVFAEEGFFCWDEEAPVEPGEDEGDEVEVEEDEGEGDATEFEGDSAAVFVP